ncbi:MAG: tRNA (adenosine(37)-N6)-dimethylallyltransferase MiaA [Candidatus Moranbacteria bacterium]|nr:tRNA (adenosine(37)-N6)-dimethylallyltransferase MiaA [Candidatus Moranbacteria bacterium]
MSQKPKVIVILGPTSCGKTKLAVDLAYKLNGEIISADSRQVYKGLDIGTGKDLKEYSFIDPKTQKKVEIKYHLIDVADPGKQFNLFDYKKLAQKAINDVISRGKLPFVVGGTGLYIDSLVFNFDLGLEKKDNNLRIKLNRSTIKALQKRLKKIDKKNRFYGSIDLANKRRVIRAIEILEKNSGLPAKTPPIYDFLILGIKYSIKKIRKRIKIRLKERLEEGLIEEVEGLIKNNLSQSRLEELGLEYKYIPKYLNGELKKKELIEILWTKNGQYAKRQLTWFKRNKNIHWVKNQKEAKKLIEEFTSCQAQTRTQPDLY